MSEPLTQDGTINPRRNQIQSSSIQILHCFCTLGTRKNGNQYLDNSPDDWHPGWFRSHIHRTQYRLLVGGPSTTGHGHSIVMGSADPILLSLKARATILHVVVCFCFMFGFVYLFHTTRKGPSMTSNIII